MKTVSSQFTYYLFNKRKENMMCIYINSISSRLLTNMWIDYVFSLSHSLLYYQNVSYQTEVWCVWSTFDSLSFSLTLSEFFFLLLYSLLCCMPFFYIFLYIYIGERERCT
jgi:hypothetical protein